MLVKLLMAAAVFAAVFFLANFLFPIFESVLKRWQEKRMQKIAPRLDEIFIDVKLKKLMLLDTIAPLAAGVLAYIFTRNAVFVGVAACAGLAIPIFIVRRLEGIRRHKFAAQLVDGLMLLSSSLKAGLSLVQSFDALVEEMPAPIAQEFSLVSRQIQMGVSLEAAMETLKKRMRLDELDLVVTAMMVARETGGNLTDVFMQVAMTIRERSKLLGRVNALCIQGKLQGIIMSALPVMFAIFVYQINPHFFDQFLHDPLGRMLLVYAAISQVLGMFFIQKFSKIDI